MEPQCQNPNNTYFTYNTHSPIKFSSAPNTALGCVFCCQGGGGRVKGLGLSRPKNVFAKPQVSLLPLEVPNVAEMKMELLKNKVSSTNPLGILQVPLPLWSWL